MGRMKELFMDRVNQIMENHIIEVSSMAEVNDLATEIKQLFGERVIYRELAVGYDVCLWDEDFERELFGCQEWRECNV